MGSAGSREYTPQQGGVGQCTHTGQSLSHPLALNTALTNGIAVKWVIVDVRAATGSKEVW